MTQSPVDCSGLPCPQPVLKCKNIIETQGPDCFSVIVDNEAARQNVSRFVGTQGYTAEVTEQGGGKFLVTATRDGAAQGQACEACEVMSAEELAQMGNSKVCVFITSDVMGRGDDELGGKLMLNFLATLPELGEELWKIIMVNAAVKLAIESSPVLDKLLDLEKSGVEILVCGTCLDFFGILDQKRVGETTNMLDVVTSLQLATKVIQV